VEEVRGSGVVGLQPTINPGQRFVYTSGAVLSTEFGTMQGSYDMVTGEGEAFTTGIPAFLLSRPLRVH
jgi:ApaG protein